ncbi:MAG: cell division protein FtsA [Anaerolineales bacterium]|nr:cell division protein FtsA [Anaerolineales bacterium]
MSIVTDNPLLVGIDVGTTKVCALVGETDEVGDLRILGVGLEPARGLRKGVVVNVEEASQAIAAAVEKAQRSAGYEIGAAFVSLAGAHIASINSRGVAGIGGGSHGIDQDDVDRALDAAQAIAIPHGREVLHVIPRAFTVDGQDGIRQPLGMHGFRLEVEAHIITAASTFVQNLTKCVEAAGVAVEAFVLNPLASGEVVLTETEKEMGAIVCDVGGGTTDLAIYLDGNVWHSLVLSVGGNHLTSDIAHGLRLPTDTAERIKLDYGHACAAEVSAAESFMVQPFGEDRPVQISRQDLATIIEARVDEMFSLVLQEVKRTGYDGLLPAGIVLTGGASLLPGLRRLAGEALNLPCRVAAPGSLKGLVDKLQGPAFSTSVGLLRWAQQESQAMLPRLNGKKRRNGHSARSAAVSKSLDIFRRLLP